MGRKHKHDARPKRNQEMYEFESDPYDSYGDELYEDFDSLSDLASDFYSTDWEEPSGPKRKTSARRQIERRNDLRDLLMEFGGWDELDRDDKWWD